MSTSVAAAPSKNAHGVMIFHPLVHLIVGIILLLGNLAGNMMQVASTESWMLGGNGAWVFNIGIWGQWVDFASGKIHDPHQMIAFVAAWGTQIVLLVSKIGTAVILAYTVSRHASNEHRIESVVNEGNFRVGVWNFLAWGIVLFDSGTDWSLSGGMGIGQQLFFCTVTFLTTFYFGTWGILNIASAISRMKKN